MERFRSIEGRPPPPPPTYWAQSRQSAKLFLQSSELGNWDSPTPSPASKRAAPFSVQWGVHYTEQTRLRDRGWGGPNSNEGHALWYSRFICTFCYWVCPIKGQHILYYTTSDQVNIFYSEVDIVLDFCVIEELFTVITFSKVFLWKVTCKLFTACLLDVPSFGGRKLWICYCMPE